MAQQGKHYLLFLSDDGTATGQKIQIECQRDLTINLGKTLSRETAKGCVHTAVEDDGLSVTSSVIMEGPPPPVGQALLWEVHNENIDGYFWVESARAGGWSFHGPCKLILTDMNAPEKGLATHSFELSADGEITQELVA